MADTAGNSELVKMMERHILFLYPALENFPSKQRHMHTKRIENEQHVLYELFIEANTRWGWHNRKEILKRADTLLKVYSFSLRFAQERRWLKTSQWEVACKQIHEIGRVIGSIINK